MGFTRLLSAPASVVSNGLAFTLVFLCFTLEHATVKKLLTVLWIGQAVTQVTSSDFTARKSDLCIFFFRQKYTIWKIMLTSRWKVWTERTNLSKYGGCEGVGLLRCFIKYRRTWDKMHSWNILEETRRLIEKCWSYESWSLDQHLPVTFDGDELKYHTGFWI